MAYGITPEGFVSKPTEDIRSELDTAFKGILGDGAGTEPDGTIPLDSPEGQLITLITDGFAELWELGEALHASFDPNQATDAAQDNLAAQSGTVRNEATYSTVTGYAYGDDGTVLQTTRRVRLDGSTTQFVSTESATLAIPIDRATLTAYQVGDIRTSGSGLSWGVLVCVTAGISSASPNPVYGTVGEIFTDGTVEWMTIAVRTTTTGTKYAVAAVPFRAQVTGPVGALAGQLTDIRTPQSGWEGVINAFDASVGRNRESNALFRARRDAELAGQGGSTPDGIRAAVLRVNAGSVDPDHQPPTVVKVFYNDTDYVDANGLPPHSVEVLVRNGTDADIAQAIFESVAAGTYTYGNQTSEVVDSEGNPQIVRWSRPEEVPIYATIVLRYNPAVWPQGSESLVAQYGLSAFLTYTTDYPIARDVRVSPLNAGILTGGAQVDSSGQAVVPAATGSAPVNGLLEVESLKIGLQSDEASQSSAQISIQSRQIAVFDSARVVISATTEDP